MIEDGLRITSYEGPGFLGRTHVLRVIAPGAPTPVLISMREVDVAGGGRALAGVEVSDGAVVRPIPAAVWSTLSRDWIQIQAVLQGRDPAPSALPTRAEVRALLEEDLREARRQMQQIDSATRGLLGPGAGRASSVADTLLPIRFAVDGCRRAENRVSILCDIAAAVPGRDGLEVQEATIRITRSGDRLRVERDR
jgi:hypothetical protein